MDRGEQGSGLSGDEVGRRLSRWLRVEKGQEPLTSPEPGEMPGWHQGGEAFDARLRSANTAREVLALAAELGKGAFARGTDQVQWLLRLIESAPGLSPGVFETLARRVDRLGGDGDAYWPIEPRTDRVLTTSLPLAVVPAIAVLRAPRIDTLAGKLIRHLTVRLAYPGDRSLSRSHPHAALLFGLHVGLGDAVPDDYGHVTAKLEQALSRCDNTGNTHSGSGLLAPILAMRRDYPDGAFEGLVRRSHLMKGEKRTAKHPRATREVWLTMLGDLGDSVTSGDGVIARHKEAARDPEIRTRLVAKALSHDSGYLLLPTLLKTSSSPEEIRRLWTRLAEQKPEMAILLLESGQPELLDRLETSALIPLLRSESASVRERAVLIVGRSQGRALDGPAAGDERSPAAPEPSGTRHAR